MENERKPFNIELESGSKEFKDVQDLMLKSLKDA